MFLDIQLGLVWAVLTALMFGEPLTWEWVALGVCFALLPDLDFWVELVRRGTVGGKELGAHRTLLHNPLVFLPAVAGCFVWGGPALGTLAVLGIYGHFVHDSIGMGYGVRWLWPFSGNFSKLFSDREGGIHYDLAHAQWTVWTRAEVERLHREHGNDAWLREDIRYHMRKLPFHLIILGFFGLLVYVLVVWFGLG